MIKIPFYSEDGKAFILEEGCLIVIGSFWDICSKDNYPRSKDIRKAIAIKGDKYLGYNTILNGRLYINYFPNK